MEWLLLGAILCLVYLSGMWVERWRCDCGDGR